MVMMFSARVWLMLSMSAASVVDLPLPVSPVTTTMPRWMRGKSMTADGKPNVSSAGMRSDSRRKSRTHMALLAEQVDAHAHAPDGLGAIQLADALDAVEAVSGQTAGQLLAIVMRQRRVAVNARVLKASGQAELHGQTAHQVHVGSAYLARHVYDVLNVHAWSFSFGLLPSPRFWHPPSSSLLQRGDGFCGLPRRWSRRSAPARGSCPPSS